MNEEIEVLKIVTERLNKAGFPYMISGSMAGNYYTVPRMTRDIDIVIELRDIDVDKFVGLFKDDFYTDKEMIKKEVLRKRMFNLIHNRYIIKIDFIILKKSIFQKLAFGRRKKILIENKPMWFITAEDLILSKLLWAKASFSETQLKDIGNLFKTVKDMDKDYIEHWIKKLELYDVYEKVEKK
ncbi:MAG: hypothetical protein ABIH00_11195 [Armatimonadota bacterium]